MKLLEAMAQGEARSDEHRRDRVLSQSSICGKDRQTEQRCLCDEQPIERISMQGRERRDAERVRVLDRERQRTDRMHASGYVLLWRLRERELAELVLDRDLPRADRGQQQIVPSVRNDLKLVAEAIGIRL